MNFTVLSNSILYGSGRGAGDNIVYVWLSISIFVLEGDFGIHYRTTIKLNQYKYSKETQ